MQPLTTEWVQKAEGDLTTAQRELRARLNPNYKRSGFAGNRQSRLRQHGGL
jgi:hypothetical protein